jgi:SAM-dependent methyltransferase
VALRVGAWSTRLCGTRDVDPRHEAPALGERYKSAVTPAQIPDRVHHPIFARLYNRVAAALDQAGAAEHRQALLSGLRGRVVEVGAGTGLNFAHYPDTVTEVVAVEPEPYLRERATETARHAPVKVVVVEGTAEAIPLDDESLDAGVASLVLCSVRDQAAALAELRRVIRPGGELRFYEHLLAQDARWARRQRRADRIWSWFAGGCHLTRQTGDAIRQAGFNVEACERFLFEPGWPSKLAAPHILGRARR